MADSSGILVPIKGDMLQVVVVDDAVSDNFPTRSKVKDARSHGASFWTRTARIDVELADGTLKRYFLKVSTGDLGMSMLRGECEGSKVVYKYTRESIPRPMAWGTYKSDPNTRFYLCEFMDMIEELRDIRKFSALLAKLHRDSMLDLDARRSSAFMS